MRRSVLPVVLFLTTIVSLFSDQYEWTGNISANPIVLGNWRNNTTMDDPALALPGPTDDVIIPDGLSTPNDPDLNVTATVQSLTIEAGGILGQTSGTLTVSSNVQLQSGSTMTITGAGSILVIRGDLTNNGILSADAAAKVRFDGTGIQTVNGTGTTTFGILELNKAVSDSFTVTTSFSAASWTMNSAGYDISLLGTTTITADTNFLNTGTVALGDGAADVLRFVGGLCDHGERVESSLGQHRGNGADRGNSDRSGGDHADREHDYRQLRWGAFATGAPISIGSVSGPSYNLDLRSRAGATTVSGAAALGSGTLRLHDNDANSTGTMSIGGALSAAGLQTQARGYAVTLSGGGTVSGAVVFSNTGVLTIGAGFVFSGGVTATAPGTVTLHGSLTTTGTAVSLGTVTLGGPSAVSTGAGAGDVTFGTTVNGANALTVTAGTGNVSFVGAVGG